MAQIDSAEYSARTLPEHPAFHWRLDGRPPWRGFDTCGLPATLQRELAYAIWRIVEQGLLIDLRYRHLVGWPVILNEDRPAAGRPPLRSLMDAPLEGWERELAKARARRTGKLGWIATGAVTLRGCYQSRSSAAFSPSVRSTSRACAQTPPICGCSRWTSSRTSSSAARSAGHGAAT